MKTRFTVELDFIEGTTQEEAEVAASDVAHECLEQCRAFARDVHGATLRIVPQGE